MIKPSLKNILTGTALFMAAVAGAQETTAAAAAPVAAAPAAPDNTVLYLLVAACATLLLAILLLSNVFIKLTGMVFDKRAGKAAAVVLLLLGANTLFAQDTAAKPYQLPIRLDLLVGIIVMVLELIVVLFMLKRISELLTELSGEKKEAKSFSVQLPHIFDNINASVSIEKEHDILLDHNYDGIRELDNALPPWWKYSFYISIVWAFFYIGYYYFGGGPSSTDEYNTEVQLAKIEVEEFNRKNANNVDENNVKLADAAGILDGQELFKNNCAACHGNSGEGNVGPNLTDSYWLHGGGLNRGV